MKFRFLPGHQFHDEDDNWLELGEIHEGEWTAERVHPRRVQLFHPTDVGRSVEVPGLAVEVVKAL